MNDIAFLEFPDFAYIRLGIYDERFNIKSFLNEFHPLTSYVGSNHPTTLGQIIERVITNTGPKFHHTFTIDRQP